MLDEVRRSYRTADMLISAHSVLRDRYTRRATILDVLILLLSTWLVAMSFVDPSIADTFSLFEMSSRETLGLIAVATFGLSIVQLRVDWKQRADRHRKTADGYLSAKFALGKLLTQENASDDEQRLALAVYRDAGQYGTQIPDRQFNALKKRHLMKVRVSKAISENPGASIFLHRMRFCFRDSVSAMKWDGREDE